MRHTPELVAILSNIHHEGKKRKAPIAGKWTNNEMNAPSCFGSEGLSDHDLEAWFTMEVLPMEQKLLSFLRHNSYRDDEPRDMLHDIYAKVWVGASRGFPEHTSGYVFAIARNYVISCAKQARVTSTHLVADMDGYVDDYCDLFEERTPERHVIARQQLERVMEGMKLLPPRCREAVHLRKIEGMSPPEIARQQGVSIATVERQLVLGMRALADFMLGGTGRVQRPSRNKSSGQLRHVDND